MTMPEKWLPRRLRPPCLHCDGMANEECRIDMGAWYAVTFLRRDLLPADCG